jgi:putative membrane protein
MILAQEDSLSNHDKEFIMNAASGNMLEVKLGKVAEKQASSEKVKKFGQHMVTNHSKANQELTEIAQKENFNPPTEMDKKDQDTYDRLSKLKGHNFDREYMRDMVSDHKGDIAAFEKESKEGKNANVKQFAEKTIPTLKEHLHMAEEIHAEVESQTK